MHRFMIFYVSFNNNVIHVNASVSALATIATIFYYINKLRKQCFVKRSVKQEINLRPMVKSGINCILST